MTPVTAHNPHFGDGSGRGRALALVLAVLVIAGCGAAPTRVERDYHIVRSGETLFTIAWRYGKDYRDLARWNDLGDGSRIYPGQLIKLYPPPGGRARSAAAKESSVPSGSAAARSSRSADPPSSPASGTREPSAAKPLPSIPTQPSPDWLWPTTGDVVVEFGHRPGTGTGILIGGHTGQPVFAAAPGDVVYSGSGLIGYGQLIIVKHNDTYLSAYGYNASLLVKEGEAVTQGQRIATMGEGPGRKPRLHFEIRQNGKPVDPRQYLPPR